jgi:hypothetical protein
MPMEIYNLPFHLAHAQHAQAVQNLLLQLERDAMAQSAARTQDAGRAVEVQVEQTEETADKVIREEEQQGMPSYRRGSGGTEEEEPKEEPPPPSPDGKGTVVDLEA